MTTKRSGPNLPDQLTRRAAEIFADGKPHPREKVILDLIRLVPPGVAMRRYKARFEFERLKKHRDPKAPPHRPMDAAAMIKSGARAAVQAILSNKVIFQRDGDELRMIAEPRIVKSDRARGVLLLPVLDELADTFVRAKDDAAFEEVKRAAHDVGLHLARCPKGCQLGGPVQRIDVADTDDAAV